MSRPERRRWERDNWPRWKNMITLRGKRTKQEQLEVIDQLLKDLGEDPDA